MELRKKKNDEPKYATDHKRTRYAKNGGPLPARDRLARKYTLRVYANACKDYNIFEFYDRYDCRDRGKKVEKSTSMRVCGRFTMQ